MSFKFESCCKRLGTWNVKSLSRPGKMSNVIMEMKRMGVVIMGVAETWWKGDGEFTTQLPDSEGGANTEYFIQGVIGEGKG